MHAILKSVASNMRLRLLVVGVVGAALLGLVSAPAQAAGSSNDGDRTAPSAGARVATDTGRVTEDSQRGGCRRSRGCYASIAFNQRTRGWAKTWNYRTRRAAVLAALHSCQRHSGSYASSCRKVGWVRNQCIAVVARFNGYGYRWGGGAARTGRKAYANARHRHPNILRHARKVTWACAG